MSNTGKKICLLGFLSGVGFAVASGCSTHLASGGTDSNTHWLDQCTTDDECGGLKCYCGVCTRPCTSDDSCAALGANAECGGLGCNMGQSVCVAAAPPTSGPGAPPTTAPDSGASTPPVSRDSGSGAPPASRDSGPGAPPPSRDSGRGVAPPSRDGGSSRPCVPMDARSSGLFCGELVGYTWNGTTCEPVYCTCTGMECDRIYPTIAACITARAACNPAAPALCDLPLEIGTCDGAGHPWGYSPAAAACVQFLYGLCGGNDNRFDTLDECNTVCAGRADSCMLCPDGKCIAPDDAGPKPSCAACPKSRDSNGDPCTEKDLKCTFLPACGAVECLCAESGESGLVWQCVGNAC